MILFCEDCVAKNRLNPDQVDIAPINRDRVDNHRVDNHRLDNHRVDNHLIDNDPIDVEQVKKSLVSFTCLTCQYKNAYKMDMQHPSKPARPNPKPYKNALKIILSDSSIIGCFIIHESKGLINNSMPRLLKQSDLLFLSKHLINAHKKSVGLFPDSKKTIWEIGDKHLIVNAIGGSLFIIITSSTSVLAHRVNQQIDLLGDLSLEGA